jgi:hypothetical protein
MRGRVGRNWPYGVVESLRARGCIEESLAILGTACRLPAGVNDRKQDRGSPRRAAAWQLIERLDVVRVHALLDAAYRKGEPVADARRLMDVWNASGIEPVARAWFESIASADPLDERARTFLHTLATHEHDAAFANFARQVLYHPVSDAGEDAPREQPRPWTLADAERAFVSALNDEGRFIDQSGRRRRSDGDVAELLSSIAALSDAGTALSHASAWLRTYKVHGAAEWAVVLAERLRRSDFTAFTTRAGARELRRWRAASGPACGDASNSSFGCKRAPRLARRVEVGARGVHSEDIGRRDDMLVLFDF